MGPFHSGHFNLTYIPFFCWSEWNKNEVDHRCTCTWEDELWIDCSPIGQTTSGGKCKQGRVVVVTLMMALLYSGVRASRDNVTLCDCSKWSSWMKSIHCYTYPTVPKRVIVPYLHRGTLYFFTFCSLIWFNCQNNRNSCTKTASVWW